MLHIAPQNFAGMPMDFVNMQNHNHYEARLVTMYKNTLNFPEDICLELPSHTGTSAKKWRDRKVEKNVSGLKYYKPKNLLEAAYFKLRDLKNTPRIFSAISKYDLFDYDIYHFDGGMDLFRDLKFARKLKSLDKKIVCCYFGSDLRTRGVFKELDEMSDLNLTVEFDHTQLYKGINYLFFPFDVKKYKPVTRNNSKIKIIHSPTNRLFKGTDKILNVIKEVESERQIEFILLENMDREEVLKIKSVCDLAIDQVGGVSGGSGYGKNSIENLAMGIPTFTEFSQEYLDFLPENPFVSCNIENLKQKLIEMIDNEPLRKSTADKGRHWVEKYHSFESVSEKLDVLYYDNKII